MFSYEFIKKIVSFLRKIKKEPIELEPKDFGFGRSNDKEAFAVLRWYQRQKDCNLDGALNLLLSDIYGVKKTPESEKLESLLEDYIEGTT